MYLWIGQVYHTAMHMLRWQEWKMSSRIKQAWLAWFLSSNQPPPPPPPLLPPLSHEWEWTEWDLGCARETARHSVFELKSSWQRALTPGSAVCITVTREIWVRFCSITTSARRQPPQLVHSRLDNLFQRCNDSSSCSNSRSHTPPSQPGSRSVRYFREEQQSEAVMVLKMREGIYLWKRSSVSCFLFVSKVSKRLN